MVIPAERNHVGIDAVEKNMLLILNIISITANLACDIPEANWHLTSIVNDPIHSARHDETAPGFKKFEKLYSDNIQLPNAPKNLLWMKWPPFPISPNRVSPSRLLTEISGPTQMVAAISKKANKLLGQVS